MLPGWRLWLPPGLVATRVLAMQHVVLSSCHHGSLQGSLSRIQPTRGVVIIVGQSLLNLTLLLKHLLEEGVVERCLLGQGGVRGHEVGVEPVCQVPAFGDHQGGHGVVVAVPAVLSRGQHVLVGALFFGTAVRVVGHCQDLEIKSLL